MGGITLTHHHKLLYARDEGKTMHAFRQNNTVDLEKHRR